MQAKSNLLIALLLCAAPVTAWAADGIGPFTNGVPTANPAEGSPPNVLSSDFSADVLVQGSNVLENPSGPITQFGFLADGTRTNLIGARGFFTEQHGDNKVYELHHN